MFNRKLFVTLTSLLLAAPALAQQSNPGVQQSGAVSANDCVKWGPGIGQIQSAGAGCTPGFTPSALTKIDDTNVTLTLTGTPATALLQAVGLTLNWSGTLATSRGGWGANISAQSGVPIFTAGTPTWTAPAALTKADDTNVTLTLGGTPSTALLRASSLTLGWAGTLAIARGGTASGTQQGALNNLMPTPTRAGDIIYYNGTNWVALAGNNSGTVVLTENASGVPSWSTAGSGDVVGPASSTDNAAARFDATTGKLLQNSALIVADTSGALSRSGNGGIPVQGSNSNTTPGAGDVGEPQQSSVAVGSAVNVSPSGAVVDITSKSLTAGNWLCSAVVATAFSVSYSDFRAWITTISVNDPGAPNSGAYFRAGGGLTSSSNQVGSMGPIRISLSATTTVYLSGAITFPSGTGALYGALNCFRQP